MGELEWVEWLRVAGLGALWLGAQIVWVAPLPRPLRRGEVPTAPKGTPDAFGLFWLDQYGYIGLAMVAAGIVLLGIGWLA